MESKILKLKNKFIKHRKFTDVAIKITGIQRFYENLGNDQPYYKITGEFWNLGFVKSFPIGYSTIFTCKQNDLVENFTFYDGEISCLRNARWESILQ